LVRQALVLGSVGIVLGATATACGGSSSDASSSGSSGTASSSGGTARRPRLTAPLHPAASCAVTIDSPELLASPHIPEGSPTSYNSNPPTSGPHYPVWANFKELTVTPDDGYLVHSLEHGAVALLYKCDGAACPTIVDALRKIRDALPSDPLCDPSIRVRIVIAPYPKLDVPVAAAAWGWTYKADCVDVPTLTQFVKDNYANGSENLCAPGRSF
jgi:hypothetical protein